MRRYLIAGSVGACIGIVLLCINSQVPSAYPGLQWSNITSLADDGYAALLPRPII
jgi:hypothetical protein